MGVKDKYEDDDAFLLAEARHREMIRAIKSLLDAPKQAPIDLSGLKEIQKSLKELVAKEQKIVLDASRDQDIKKEISEMRKDLAALQKTFDRHMERQEELMIGMLEKKEYQVTVERDITGKLRVGRFKQI